MNETSNTASIFAELNSSLRPYILKNEIIASTVGIPVMRSMAQVFPDDSTCTCLNAQYMLGDSLLAAPASHDEIFDKFYLPEGLWTNYFTGKEYKGGTWISREQDNIDTPIMMRENSVIPTKSYDNSCELRVYAFHNGIQVDLEVYGSDNDIELIVSVRRLGRSINIISDGTLPYSIRMINMQAKSAVNGFLTIEGNDSIVTPDRGAEMLEIKF